jgi:ElaB/YqjD/DUF883 family membrane-anchored ribosome-binding protein
MKRHLVLAAFLTCLASAAGAQLPTAEALPDAYPDPPCIKPQVNMVKPESANSNAVSSYNVKVKTFNKQAAAYDACMHAYIDKANGDVKTIQDKANADLKQVSERANGSMKAIQDKIRQAVAEAKSVAADIDEQTARLRKQ